jgi:hypothetical protein
MIQSRSIASITLSAMALMSCMFTGCSEADEPSDLTGLGDFLDERTGHRKLLVHGLDEPVRGGARWAYVFGSALLGAFVVQLVTGGALMTSKKVGHGVERAPLMGYWSYYLIWFMPAYAAQNPAAACLALVLGCAAASFPIPSCGFARWGA